jgi:CheY-like chemotaxis protein
MVSMLIEDMLLELGCELAGTAAQVSDALEHLSSLSVDVAVLDVNLGGSESAAVAQLLTRRNIPFIAATGYGSTGLPKAFAGAPVLQKPFQQRELAATLAAVAGRETSA